MKRATLVVLAVVLLVSAAFADDIWKSKPYQQWDLKDVQKILADSPWAHVVHVTASWRKPGDKTIPLEPGGSDPAITARRVAQSRAAPVSEQVTPLRPAPPACRAAPRTPAPVLSRKIKPS